MKGILATMASQSGVSGARYSLFGSFKNGMSTLVDTLAKKLDSTSIHLNADIKCLEFETSSTKWRLTTNDSKMEFDHVFLATAPYQIANFLGDLSTDEKKLLQSIHYASSAVFHFGFKEEQIPNKPNAVGFIVPNREHKHFIACSFVSDKYENRAPQGYILVRAFCGGALQEHHLNMDSKDLRNIVLKELREVLNIQGEPMIEDYAKWPQSMPQYTMGHIERITQIKTTISQFPNLHIIGNGYGGVGIPDLIEQANLLAARVLD
jgi:oxygen-dependent protoporphyrinogen oxidase